MRQAIVRGVLLCMVGLLVPLGAWAQGKFEVYGHADLSWDLVDQGTSGNLSNYSCGGTTCQSVNPYSQVSSNSSYLGFRFSQDIGDSGVKALLQVETLVELAATPSERASLGSRDSYLGLAGGFGAVKIGKSDSPYKRSTARLDPFANTVGDYNAIMGNTGGDGRAEFDLRLPNAIWYESPKLGGLTFNLMAAPGQNRASNTSDLPQGNFVCSGSTPHQSGADPDATNGCNDGSFGDAYSANVAFEHGPLYFTAAYEIHQMVNRHGDDASNDLSATVGVHDESATKFGVQFKTDTTTISAAYENMVRDRGNEPDKVDERTRSGYYLSGVQRFADTNEVSLAWAHANKTPGDPGVTSTVDLSNQADLTAVGYRKFLAKQFSIYAVFAQMNNNAGAHYILGSSGHGVGIYGRDGQGRPGVCDPNFGCIPSDANGVARATVIRSFSIGMRFYFSAPFDVKVSQE